MTRNVTSPYGPAMTIELTPEQEARFNAKIDALPDVPVDNLHRIARGWLIDELRSQRPADAREWQRSS